MHPEEGAGAPSPYDGSACDLEDHPELILELVETPLALHVQGPIHSVKSDGGPHSRVTEVGRPPEPVRMLIINRAGDLSTSKSARLDDADSELTRSCPRCGSDFPPTAKMNARDGSTEYAHIETSISLELVQEIERNSSRGDVGVRRKILYRPCPLVVRTGTGTAERRGPPKVAPPHSH